MTLLKLRSDEELAELGLNAAWRQFGGRCPTCDGTGTYRFHGKKRKCLENPIFEYHEQWLKFRTYCLANIPMEFQVLDLETFPDQEVKSDVKTYIENYSTIRRYGLGWEIYGKDRGVGKSWIATAILKALVNQGYSGWFMQFNDAKSLHETYDARRKDFFYRKLRETEVLVLDDILEPSASEAQRRFYEERLEDIIRFRTTNCFPTITTTNLDQEKMNHYYPRVHSLLSAKQKRLELSGDDYRGKKWHENETAVLNGEVLPIV